MKGLANANTEIIAFEVGVQKKIKFVIFLIFENVKELKILENEKPFPI